MLDDELNKRYYLLGGRMQDADRLPGRQILYMLTFNTCCSDHQHEPEEARGVASRGNRGSSQLPRWATFKTRVLRGLKASEKTGVLPV